MLERHVFLAVLIFTLLAIAVAMFIPPNHEPRPAMLPWAISVHEDGSSTVFGLKLGHSTLGEAEQTLQQEAEFTLFVAPDGRMAAEGYFDSVSLSGIGGKLVLEMALAVDELTAMEQRGLRVATLGDGSRKVTLHPDDIARLRATAIASVTYLPKLQLDEALVEKRFGVPEQRLSEPKALVEHWLYPAKGLDVAISAEHKEVLQYVAPREFSRLLEPLLARTGAAEQPVTQ